MTEGTSLPSFGADEEARAVLSRINETVDAGTLSIGCRVQVGLNVLAGAIKDLPINARREVIAVILPAIVGLDPAPDVPVETEGRRRAA